MFPILLVIDVEETQKRQVAACSIRLINEMLQTETRPEHLVGFHTLLKPHHRKGIEPERFVARVNTWIKLLCGDVYEPVLVMPDREKAERIVWFFERYGETNPFDNEMHRRSSVAVSARLIDVYARRSPADHEPSRSTQLLRTELLKIYWAETKARRGTIG